ncbi:MAG: hypothetical protein ACK5WD_09560 [bacterium]
MAAAGTHASRMISAQPAHAMPDQREPLAKAHPTQSAAANTQVAMGTMSPESMHCSASMSLREGMGSPGP